jgi:hypothetical protein
MSIKSNLPLGYIKKIHQCNLGMFSGGGDISDLSITPQSSNCHSNNPMSTIKGSSDNDTLLDKTQSQLDQQSFTNDFSNIS